MQENEQGLTIEEKVMFSFLGIILLIALGVLVFNSISNHERKAESAETKETENIDPTVDEKEPENKQKDDQKSEDKRIIKIDTVSNVVKKSSKNNSTKNNQNNVEKETNEGTGSTDQGEVDDEAAVYEEDEELDWTFNSNIIKEAYADEVIQIPSTVKLENGKEKEAIVVLKEKETDKEITIENNEVSLPAGEYVYYYTCNNKTKNIPLVVYNRLDNVKITIAEIKETASSYNEDLAFLIKESTISNNKNEYQLNIKRQNNYNLVPLKVELEKNYNKIESLTEGFTVSNDQETISLKNNEFLIWLDLNKISITKDNKVFLNIDGKEYLFIFKIKINNVTEETKEEEQQPANNDEIISNEDNDKKEPKEEEDEPDKPKPEPPKEDPVVEEKPIVEEKTNSPEVVTTEETQAVEETEVA